MLTITPQAVPNQQVQVQLGQQGTTLNIYQTNFGLFMDIYLSNTLIIAGVLCLNVTRIVRDAYLGFSGDLVWFDTEGTADPVYTGIGTRYLLIYLEPTDLTNLGVG